MSYSVTKPLYFDFTARGDRAGTTLSALLRLWHFRWSSRRTLATMPQEHLAQSLEFSLGVGGREPQPTN